MIYHLNLFKKNEVKQIVTIKTKEHDHVISRDRHPAEDQLAHQVRTSRMGR